MAKMTKKQSEAIGILIIVALIIGVIVKFFETVGFIIPIIVIGACIGIYFFYQSSEKKKRLEYLKQKYIDDEIVNNLFKGVIWQGETAEQLIDSIGNPVAVDNKLLKTKKKEVWKYDHQGANRYNLRITLENDIVVGWDKKA